MAGLFVGKESKSPDFEGSKVSDFGLRVVLYFMLSKSPIKACLPS
jgi:hypothetical protein